MNNNVMAHSFQTLNSGYCKNFSVVPSHHHHHTTHPSTTIPLHLVGDEYSVPKFRRYWLGGDSVEPRQLTAPAKKSTTSSFVATYSPHISACANLPVMQRVAPAARQIMTLVVLLRGMMAPPCPPWAFACPSPVSVMLYPSRLRLSFLSANPTRVWPTSHT